jgi:hypothetical protein
MGIMITNILSVPFATPLYSRLRHAATVLFLLLYRIIFTFWGSGTFFGSLFPHMYRLTCSSNSWESLCTKSVLGLYKTLCIRIDPEIFLGFRAPKLQIVQ